MNDVIEILRRRNNEAYENKHNLPLEGTMSIQGHRDAFRGYQTNLGKKAKEFEKKCSYSKFGKNYKATVRYWQTKKISSPWNLKYYRNGRYSPTLTRAAGLRVSQFRGGAVLARGGAGGGRPWGTK